MNILKVGHAHHKDIKSGTSMNILKVGHTHHKDIKSGTSSPLIY